MKIINKVKIVSVILFLMIGYSSYAGVLVAKYNGSAFSIVNTSETQEVCGAKFEFRDEHKKMVPAYLEPALIKFSFSGKKLHSTLNKAKEAAKSSGKCIWLSSEEKGSL